MQFCRRILSRIRESITLVDVGSGGPLKEPWNIFPASGVNIVGFEPTMPQAKPFCISNRTGDSEFFVARDERSSSLHPVSERFIDRFGYSSMKAERRIRVRRTTLDRYLGKSSDTVDALDVNVEGHDFQALQGAKDLLKKGSVKLLKTEFELTEVWTGQGWFSDIDGFLRKAGYELIGLEMEFARPLRAASAYHRGEPLWGKALYMPSTKLIQERWKALGKGAPGRRETEILKSVALSVAADAPGRALEILALAGGAQVGTFHVTELEDEILGIYRYAKLDKLISLLMQTPVNFVRGFARRPR